jgi:predicted transcriptional regulator
MEKTSITVRVDAELKSKVEEACEYLGENVTSVIHQAFRQQVDRYYKARASDTRLVRDIADGDNYQLMFNAAKREAYVLQKLGIDSVHDLLTTPDATKKTMFYELLLQQYLNDNGIEYVPKHLRTRPLDSTLN